MQKFDFMSWLLKFSLILSFQSLTFAEPLYYDGGIEIQIADGRIWTPVQRASDGSTVYAFKGIPYAKPPLGDLRFQLPQMPDVWTSVLNTTEYGPACPQNSATSSYKPEWMDEDCLQINIFTSQSCLISRNCPVYFYLHGGGMLYDSATMFNDSVIMETFSSEDIILVSPGFRIGFLGMFSLKDDLVVPRNLAVHDVLLALTWVNENIIYFGGDPKQVTVAGHSYGGTMAVFLSLSKSVDPHQKLFNKVIAMSPALFFADNHRHEILSIELLRRTGCSNVSLDAYIYDVLPNTIILEQMQCLKSKTIEEILEVQGKMDIEGKKLEGILRTSDLFPSSTYIDFTLNPPTRPLLIGTLPKEFDGVKVEEENFLEPEPHRILRIMDILDFKNKNKVPRKYFDDLKNKKLAFEHVLQTQEMFITLEMVAKSLAEAKAKVYVYKLINGYPYHSLDYMYTLGVHLHDLDENELILQKLVRKYVTNFVKYGHTTDDWQVYKNDFKNYFYIQVDVKSGLLPHNEMGYEREVNQYWHVAMRDFDNELFLNGSINKGLRNINLDKPSNIGGADEAFYILYLILCFFAIVIGFILGQLYCLSRNHAYLYKFEEETPLFSSPKF